MNELENIKIVSEGTETDYGLGPVSSGVEQAPELVLQDVNGKNVAIFEDGHLRTKKFDSSCHTILPVMELGTIYGNGRDGNEFASVAYESMKTAFYIDVAGASAILLDRGCTVFQFDSTHNLLSRVASSAGLFKLLENCKYIRLQTQVFIPESVVISTYGGGIPLEKKRVQTNETEEKFSYPVTTTINTSCRLLLPPNYDPDGTPVPLILWDSGDGSFSSWDTHQMGAEGAPGRVTGLHFLRDSGFAVLEIYSWGSYNFFHHQGCGVRSAMPIAIHLETHEKGVEYVCSRFNIDHNMVFHISKSGSGKIALYYALQKPGFGLKSIYAMAPVFDDLNFVGWGTAGYRSALFDALAMRGDAETEGTPAYQFIHGTPVEEGGYNGTGWVPRSDKGKQFIAENADKFTKIVPGWMNLCGQTIAEKMQDTFDFADAFWEGYTYNSETGRWSWTDSTKLPASRGDVCYTRDNLVMVGNHIPFTVIMSPTDEQTPYWDALEVVKQLMNGGDDASMVTLATGGHSGPDLSTAGANVVENVTTRLGYEYATVSIGWYLAVEDISARFLK